MKKLCFASIGLLALAACSDRAPSADPATTAPPGAGNPPSAQPPDGSASDAGVVAIADAGDAGDGGQAKGPPPSILPVPFSRPDVGAPLTQAELAAATDELIDLLKDTRYFDFVDERVHGWPESDPNKGFWYGHFWSGVTLTKTAGQVTYKHSSDGADNAGIHTSPYLEGACYAYLMWGDPKTAHLVRRMVRAYSAWILAMVRSAGDSNPPLLARAFYRPNVVSTDGNRNLLIDYSASYPGIDAAPSEYVHLPTNPTFGDIYVKNKRSKDDIGHMLRAMTQASACAPRLDAAGQSDVAQMNALFSAWAQRVDAQGFAIETLDKSANLWTPSDQLAHYTLIGNAECLGALAIRLKGQGTPGNLDCQSGLQSVESAGWSFLKNDARQILRTNHAAALALAYQRGQNTVALSLLQGLAQRLDLDMGLATSASPPAGFSLADVGSALAFAANLGVPLTSREIRWLHGKLHEAHDGMRAPALKPTFDVFDPQTPDGTYSYDPPNIGLFYRDLGMLIGSCASPYRNPNGRPLLDCNRLLAAL